MEKKIKKSGVRGRLVRCRHYRIGNRHLWVALDGEVVISRFSGYDNQELERKCKAAASDYRQHVKATEDIEINTSGQYPPCEECGLPAAERYRVGVKDMCERCAKRFDGRTESDSEEQEFDDLIKTIEG